MKNTSRKSVQDRFNLMWKRISNAHYVHRKLWSVLAFKSQDLKMPQCFDGNEEYFFFCIFSFLLGKNKEDKEKPSSPQEKYSSDQHNYNPWMGSAWPCPEAMRPSVAPGNCLEESSLHKKGTAGPWEIIPLNLLSPMVLLCSGTFSLSGSKHILWTENQGLPNIPSLALPNPAPTHPSTNHTLHPNLCKPVAIKPFTKAMASLSLCPSIAGDKIPHFYSKKGLNNFVLEFQNNNNFKNLSYVRRCHCISSLSFSRPSSKPYLCFLPS